MIYLKAKTVEQVQNWIATTPHHEARAITVKASTEKGPPVAIGIELISDRQAIRISSEIWGKSLVTPYGAPEGYMFRVDPYAVAVKEMLGKYVTTSTLTYERVPDKYAHEVGGMKLVGVRQAVYVGVDWLQTDGDDKPAVPYYKSIGRLGKYYQLATLDSALMHPVREVLFDQDEEFRLKVCKEEGLEP